MLQKRLFIILAILNAFDGLATAYGLHLDLVEEQNPVALYLWEKHPIVFIGSKLLLSMILLYFPFFTNQAIWEKKFWTATLVVLTTVYVLVDVIHVVWLGIYFKISYF